MKLSSEGYIYTYVEKMNYIKRQRLNWSSVWNKNILIVGILEETNTYWLMICVLRTGLRMEGCGMSGFEACSCCLGLHHMIIEIYIMHNCLCHCVSMFLCFGIFLLSSSLLFHILFLIIYLISCQTYFISSQLINNINCFYLFFLPQIMTK